MNEARALLRIAKGLLSREKPELFRVYTEDVKFPNITVKMPGGARIKHTPKKSFSSVFWYPDDRQSPISYFQMWVPRAPADWEQDPSKPFRMVVKIAFAGGHIQKEVPIVIKPGNDPAKSIEDALKRQVPKVIERYLARNMDDIVDQVTKTNEALAEYYRTHKYTGD